MDSFLTRKNGVVLRETNFQNWRAVAISVGIHEVKERLIVLGTSHVKIRQSYLSAFDKVLNEEERKETKKIIMQQWIGTADMGSWKNRAELPMNSGVPAIAV